MWTASYVGQKGGVGKSTLARVLAVAECSATRLRNGIEPDIEARAFKSLKKLRKLVESFDLVAVEPRGLADELTTDISQESGLIFLPTGTSMYELSTTLASASRPGHWKSRKRNPQSIFAGQ